jgi:hypothetical protein
METKLNLKTFAYIVSALCVSGFLALIMIGVIFANAFELQQDLAMNILKLSLESTLRKRADSVTANL